MKHCSARHGLAKMNLTPMIDVVFLLIIFFVFSGTMTRQEELRLIPLPTVGGGEDTENRATGKLVISIAADGFLFVGNQPTTLDDLKARLLRERESSALPLEVRVRADRNLSWHRVEPILLLCAEAGIGDLSFSILPK
ncbi:MAG: ExbD/TolR family protein [Thermoguttaceae bacterium]